jgi:hypothetical protein
MNPPRALDACIRCSSTLPPYLSLYLAPLLLPAHTTQHEHCPSSVPHPHPIYRRRTTWHHGHSMLCFGEGCVEFVCFFFPDLIPTVLLLVLSWFVPPQKAPLHHGPRARLHVPPRAYSPFVFLGFGVVTFVLPALWYLICARVQSSAIRITTHHSHSLASLFISLRGGREELIGIPHHRSQYHHHLYYYY